MLTRKERTQHTLRKGRIFDSYSTFRIFERFPAIRFNSKIRSYTRISPDIVSSCSPSQNQSRAIFYYSDSTITETTTAKLLVTYLICIRMHTLGYKIKSLTLLKRINFTKQTRVKLAGNAVLSPSVAATRSLP